SSTAPRELKRSKQKAGFLSQISLGSSIVSRSFSRVIAITLHHPGSQKPTENHGFSSKAVDIAIISE
ncbi:hypothetical protein, partial [Pseudomonas savastanoi]